MMKKKWLVLSFLLAIPLAAIGDGVMQEDQLRELLEVKIRSVRSIALDPAFVEAVRAQNNEKLTFEAITERNREWTETRNLNSLKYALQTNEAGKRLRSYVDYNTAFSEAFLADNQGANVAAYPATSAYWQGDEEPWQLAFNEGKGNIYIGSVKRDENTEMDVVKIGAPVLDSDGSAIGVLVVGVPFDYLKDRMERLQ
jgi:hypothetical protein